MAKLSDTKIRATKPRAKPFKLFDSDGLFMIIRPDGAKWWRQRYRWNGQEKTLSVGAYPEVGLAIARERSAKIRKQVALHVDPSAARRAEKIAKLDAAASTLEAVARSWHAKFSPGWTEKHAARVLRRLEMHVFPVIGSKPISEVTASDAQAVLDALAKRKKIDTALRTLQYLKDIAVWAAGRKMITASPFAHVSAKRELPSVDVKHRACLKTPQQVRQLMRAISTYQGSFTVKMALEFLARTFVRPVECREARWSEFDLDCPEPLWRIPAAKMKMKDDHIVPLAAQVVSLLRELHQVTGDDRHGRLFPGTRPGRPLSENTLNSAIRALGFTQDQHCSHGFRGTASTLLNEQQWPGDAIELQLAHCERDQVRASYNAAQHLPLRRKMMQAWSDHLDTLKAGENVVPLRKSA